MREAFLLYDILVPELCKIFMCNLDVTKINFNQFEMTDTASFLHSFSIV